jgi:hypothetical protein
MTERHSPAIDILLLPPLLLLLELGVESLVTVATEVAVAVKTPPPSAVEVGMAGLDDSVVVGWPDGVAVSPRAFVQYSLYTVNAEGTFIAVAPLHRLEIHLERYDTAIGDLSGRQKHPLR